MASIDRFIAVVTYGRSGSTLLQRLLQTIPNACIRGENQNVLFHLFSAWSALATAQATYAVPNADDRDPWWGIAEADPAGFAREMVNGFIAGVLNPPLGSTVVGFKEIRYHETGASLIPFLNFMRDFLPNCRFIFLTRDLDQVVKSGWWATRDPNVVRAMLSKAEMRFEEFAASNKAVSYWMTYADIVGKTERVNGLFEFLGLNPDMAKIDAVIGEKLRHAGRQDSGTRTSGAASGATPNKTSSAITS